MYEMSLIANTETCPRERRLTQKRAGFVLAVGLLAVPLIPMVLEAVVPEREWDAAAPGGSEVELVSADGHAVAVTAPNGWQARDDGDSAVLRRDGGLVLVQVYDRAGREPGAVTERLLRANRVQGMPAALDGGQIASADGEFAGDTCVVVTDDLTGTCAYLADDDVVVSVIAFGDPGHPVVPLADIVSPLARPGSEGTR
jgi:hypothetical protein